MRIGISFRSRSRCCRGATLKAKRFHSNIDKIGTLEGPTRKPRHASVSSTGTPRSTLWTNTGKTETFRELWAPLVHTNSHRGNSYGPIIGPYEFPGEIRMDQWSWESFKSFPLHWYWSRDGSSQHWHSDTQAVPAFHCKYESLKKCFRHASVYETHRHAVYHCLKEVQKPFRHASVWKKVRFDPRVSVFETRVFAHLSTR